jgi:hypothetical protein
MDKIEYRHISPDIIVSSYTSPTEAPPHSLRPIKSS